MTELDPTRCVYVVRERNPAGGGWDKATRTWSDDAWVRDDAGNIIMRQCMNRPVTGSDRCRMHVNSATIEKLRKARKLKKLMPKIKQLLDECDIPNQHPLEGLLEAVRYTGALVRAIKIKVEELNADPETLYSGGGIVLVEPGLYGPDHLGDGKPHVLVEMYGYWIDKYTRACKLALDADIDERLVRSAESTSSEFFTAFVDALSDVDLTPAQREQLNAALADRLRKLAPGAGAVIDVPPRGLPS